MVVGAVLTGERERTQGAERSSYAPRVSAYSPVRPIAITSHEGKKRKKKETPNNRQTYIGFENIAGHFRDEFANIIYSEAPF